MAGLSFAGGRTIRVSPHLTLGSHHLFCLYSSKCLGGSGWKERDCSFMDPIDAIDAID
jgi:hypothetical protein